MTNDSAQSRFPWARRDEIGPRRAAWRTLWGGLLRPGAVLTPAPGEETGPRYLAFSYGLHAVALVLALNGALALIHAATGFFKFDDINPNTLVVAAPVQFVFALLIAWIWSWTLYAGLSLLSVAGRDQHGQIRALAWCHSASFHALQLWFWGFLIPAFVLADAVGVDLNDFLSEGVVIPLAILAFLILMARQIIASVGATFQAALAKALGASLVALVLFFIAMIPVVIVMQIVLVAILRAFM